MKNIRLNKKYIATIKSLSLKYFDSEEICIFGSRTDLNKRGGDIDIYIKTQKSDNILKSKLQFLRDFEKLLGQQKIDLIIEHNNSKHKKIYEEAKSTGVRI